jgi:uncharacterized protein YjdB
MRLTLSIRPSDRRRRLALATAGIVLLGSCDSPFDPNVEEVTRIEINPPVLTMVVGGNTTLTARVYGAGDNLLPAATVFWSSQNPDVVTITQEGVATALASGTAQIAASAGGQSRTIAVTVSQVPIFLVRISPPAGNVVVGSTLTLTGEALDGTGAVLPNRVLEWSSSAPQIASVNGTGVVTGVSTGEATISATGEGKTGTALVTVFPSPIATISIAPNGGSLPAGATQLFVATPRDAGGQELTGRTLEWRSSNDAVATISSSGLLTAISPGTVTVTVSAPGGGPGGTTPTASVQVTVLIEPVVTAVIVPSSASVQVGQTVPLTVNLFNSAGDPLSAAGRTITWSSSAMAVATISASGGVTGVAVGTATITARVTTTGQAGAVQGTAQVTVTNQPAANLVITTQPPASANSGQVLSTSPVVQLKDGSGNNVSQAGVAITASVQPSAGVTLSGSSATSNASGTATFSALTLNGPAGSYTLTFSSGSLPPVTSTAITLSAGSGSRLALIVQPSVSAPSGSPFAIQPQVQLLDGSGNPVSQSGVLVTAAILTGGGTLGGTTTATTNSSGVAAFTNLSITGTLGARTLLFGASGYTTVTSSPINITAGAAAALAIVTQPSASAQSGTPFATQPAVQLEDESGNPVAQGGVVVTVSVNGAGASLIGGTSATTNSSGVATFSGLGLSGTVGSYSLSFVSGTLTGVTSSSINLAAGAAAQLTITTQPAGATSGNAFTTQPAIQVRDAGGNPVSQAGVTVSASVNEAGASLIGTTTAQTNASGVATFANLGLSGTTGRYTLDFSASGVPNVTSGPINLGAAVATQLTISTQPSTTVASGSALAQAPAVQLRDAGGNAVAQSGVSVTVAISGSGASLTGSTSVTTNASGIATFTGLGLTGTVGSYTLQFSSSGLTAATSSAISLTPGPAAALSMTAQPPASALSGVAFSSAPVVQVRDASGNAVSQSGVNVTAAVTGGGTSLVGSTLVTTNGSGVATFSGLGISDVGTWTIDFTATGLTSVTSSAVVVTEPASQLGMVAQPSASAQSGQAFATQPSVRLFDSGGNPVSQAGVTVTAEITGGGATLLGTASVSTDAAGVASFTDLGIAGTIGSYSLTFKSAGLTNAVSNPISLTAGVAAKLSIAQQPSSFIVNGAPFPTQPIIQLRDAQDNVVTTSGINVTATLNGSGGTLGGTTDVASDGSGQSAYADLSISGPISSSYSITFSASGTTGVTSNTITIIAFALGQSQPEGVLDRPRPWRVPYSLRRIWNESRLAEPWQSRRIE